MRSRPCFNDYIPYVCDTSLCIRIHLWLIELRSNVNFCYIVHFQDHNVVGNLHNRAVKTSDRYHFVALGQGAKHGISGLLFLLLWTNKQKIKMTNISTNGKSIPKCLRRLESVCPVARSNEVPNISFPFHKLIMMAMILL